MGLLAGAILTFLILLVMAVANKNYTEDNDDGINFFSTEREYEGGSTFEVFQVLDPQHALAWEQEKSKYSDRYSSTGVVVLLLDQDGSMYFYDRQIVKASPSQHVKLVGTYSYFNRENMEMTVPVIVIE